MVNLATKLRALKSIEKKVMKLFYSVKDIIIVEEINFNLGLCLLPVELVTNHVRVVDALLQVTGLFLELEVRVIIHVFHS